MLAFFFFFFFFCINAINAITCFVFGIISDIQIKCL